MYIFYLEYFQNGIRPEMCVDKDKADFDWEGQWCPVTKIVKLFNHALFLKEMCGFTLINLN